MSSTAAASFYVKYCGFEKWAADREKSTVFEKIKVLCLDTYSFST